MPNDFHALSLNQYATQLPDPTERERVLHALQDAEMLPIDSQVLDDIEARFGDGTGLIDANAYIQAELSARQGRSEYEALMLAAELVRVLVALKAVDTPSGTRFIRVDAIQ